MLVGLLLGFALGILCINIITLVVFILTGEEEKITVQVACGIVWYIALGFCFIVRAIKERKKN